MTIFSKIINKEIPCDFVYEDELCIVINDIHPKAKTHLLIIPKKPIPTINDIIIEDSEIISRMFFVARDLAKKMWIQDWYQLHFNVWSKWWQEVMHIHLHLMSDL